VGPGDPAAARGQRGPHGPAAQHLRHVRQPPQAAEALERPCQPRPVQDDAAGPRAGAAHPADGLPVRLGLRVGPARRHRPGGRADRRRIDRVAAGPARRAGPARPGAAAGGEPEARRPASPTPPGTSSASTGTPGSSWTSSSPSKHLHPDRDGPALLGVQRGGRRPRPPDGAA
jgi:hypothetical protein